MDRKLEAQLTTIPRLTRENAEAAELPCKICRRPAAFFDVVDFQKCVGAYMFGPSGIHVAWHRCENCGFLFTSFFDDWSPADFARFIYNDDYILIDPDYLSIRPKAVGRMMANLLAGHEDAKILDYGAGSGVFAETMSEFGFHRVESYDPFSLPERPIGKFDIITCNEVIEHTPFPLRMAEDMRSMLQDEGCIILGETLQPPDIGLLRGNWWYVAPRNGHVSTYTDQTFACIAGGLGLVYHRGGGSIHALRTPHNGVFAELARRCGPSLMACRLGAPGSGPAEGWWSLEDRPPRQFRWTTTKTPSWHGIIPAWNPQCLKVMVPFVHESRHGFAAECVIEVNGRAARTWLQDRVILGEIEPIDVGKAVVTLRTPDLTPTGDHGTGLAILVI